MSSRRQMLEFLSLSRLPSAYQEVEWIGSSGTQYVNSGLVLTQNSKIEITCSFSKQNVSSPVARGFFGARNGADSNNISISYYETTSNNSGSIDFNNGNYETYRLTQLFGNQTKYKIVIDKNGRYIYSNDTLISSNTNVCSDNINSGLNAFIFATNGTTWTCAFSKVYRDGCLFYENGILQRNFVPCYRKADNVAGLYDLVNGVFYTNAGTGTFIVGGNV